jgi:hypothetical protein
MIAALCSQQLLQGYCICVAVLRTDCGLIQLLQMSLPRLISIHISVSVSRGMLMSELCPCCALLFSNLHCYSFRQLAAK